ncbi:MAG: hypothetical protein H7334_00670 [Ferruginibacter sp.]|nr:hypothetical protein [Ferruginibacter sp.]
MQHIINKQVIELSLAKQQDAFGMQHSISRHYYSDLLPLLEKVFNQYSTEDEVLVLDKLEIKLGNIPQKDIGKDKWDDSVLSLIELKIEESLVSFLENNTAVRKPLLMNDCRQWMFYMQHGYLGWNTLCINEQWHNNVLAVLATDFAGITLLRNQVASHPGMAYRIALQHEDIFLSNLAAVLTTMNQQKLADAINEMVLLLRQLAELASLQLLASNTLKKLLWQQAITIASTTAGTLSTQKIITILLQPYVPQLSLASIQWQKKILEPVTAIQPILGQIFQSIASNKKDHQAFTDEDMVNKNLGNKNEASPNRAGDAIHNKPIESTTSLSQQDDEKATENLSDLIASNQAAAEGNVDKKGTGDTALDINIAGNGPTKNDKEDAIIGGSTISDNDQIINETDLQKNNGSDKNGKALPDKTSANNNGQTIINDKEPLVDEGLKIPENLLSTDTLFNGKIINSQPTSNDIPNDGIFIVNAGIVLAHSFIGFLFKRLGLVEANNFKDADAQIKAIFLLHYLSTGNTTAAEHELVLCKLLCAYPINTPIPSEQIFLQAEFEEANNMLVALLQQWNKLQNTSIEGLRESFLQRKGKIFTKGERVIVQVEQSSLDILLDYLPWNLSIIKLPWMKEIVHVEWR